MQLLLLTLGQRPVPRAASWAVSFGNLSAESALASGRQEHPATLLGAWSNFVAKQHFTCAGRDSVLLWHRRGSGAACSGGKAAQRPLAAGLQGLNLGLKPSLLLWGGPADL